MIDRNGVRVGVAGALLLVSGALRPVTAQTAAQDAKSVVRVATAKPTVRDTRVTPAVAQAAMQGDLAKVRALIAQQNDVNAAQGDGMTALHWAADRGDVAMAALLLRSGAKLTGTTRNGAYTPLHVAARAGQGAIVQALLAAGADAGTLTATGATAMHLAASAGDAASVKALLAKKADPNARESAWGQTPLMFAAAENRGDAARALLAGGADASIRTRSVDLTEELARQQAAAKKRNEVLFSYLPQKTRDSIIDAAAKATEKLAADAAAARNRAAAAAGMAAPTATASTAAAPTAAAPAAAAQAAPAPAAAPAAAAPVATAPTAAAPAANPALRGYKIGVNAPPTQELTPAQIQEAIEAGRALFRSGPVAKTTESAELFEGQVAGYEATVGSMGGMTALHHAARQGNIDAALAILDGGGKINEVTTSDSTTAVLMAAINGHFDLAMALVKRGADVKIASSAGLTPLYAALNTMWAPRSRYPQPQAVQTQKVTHLELMDAMLKSGADVNVRLRKNLWFFAFNNCGNANCGLEALDGTTPFWRATYAVDVEAMKLLKAHGALDTVPSYRAPVARGNRARFPGGFGEGPAAFVMSPAIDSASKAVPAGIGVYPVHAAAGVGYGNGFAGNSHRHATDGWMPAMKYLVEVLHADVNQRDLNGYTPLHHAAARGDNEMIEYLVSKGADPKAVARNGMTTVDMANGPVQRLRPFPDTILLLEKLGAKNSHRCVAC